MHTTDCASRNTSSKLRHCNDGAGTTGLAWFNVAAIITCPSTRPVVPQRAGGAAARAQCGASLLWRGRSPALQQPPVALNQISRRRQRGRARWPCAHRFHPCHQPAEAPFAHELERVDGRPKAWQHHKEAEGERPAQRASLEVAFGRGRSHKLFGRGGGSRGRHLRQTEVVA